LLIRWLALWKLRRLTAAEVAPRVRTIKVSIEMNAYLASSWPSIAQVAQLTRTVTKAGKTTTEVVYLITTLSSSKASPERLLELNRGHWSIENRLHSVRDVSFREDRSRLRTGNAPHILAALRNLSIALIHRSGSSQITATRQHFASCPHQALALLLARKGGQQSFTSPAPEVPASSFVLRVDLTCMLHSFEESLLQKLRLHQISKLIGRSHCA